MLIQNQNTLNLDTEYREISVNTIKYNHNTIGHSEWGAREDPIETMAKTCLIGSGAAIRQIKTQKKLKVT